jgi:SAM-dependent methyltransferase
MTSTYDRIGATYAATRRADPRIAGRILEALGDATSVVNVGAGAGAYEPTDRFVVGVEPSATMIRQRAPGSARVVQAWAEALPFADGAFEAALAVLTVHHWSDVPCGLGEVRRVTRRRAVVLTWDQDVWESFWLIREYLPCIRDLDRPRAIPMRDLVSTLGGGSVLSVPIPHDCVDGIHGAFWRRPEAYLDPRVRAGISTYALMSAADRDHGLRALAADLQSGAWHERHGDLLERDELDLGYRLVVAEW